MISREASVGEPGRLIGVIDADLSARTALVRLLRAVGLRAVAFKGSGHNRAFLYAKGSMGG